jgi:hypothetical protein
MIPARHAGAIKNATAAGNRRKNRDICADHRALINANKGVFEVGKTER